jgi:hypothetical protein
MIKVGRRAFVAALALVGPMFRAAPRAQSFSVDEFLALSSRLTGHSSLDRATGAIFLKSLLSEPGSAARLTRPDAALEREIILAWYTGVQTVRGNPQTVTHTGALQWRTLGMPAPGMCAGSFGAWSKPGRPSER